MSAFDVATARSSLIRDGFTVIRDAFSARSVEEIVEIHRLLVAALDDPVRPGDRFRMDMGRGLAGAGPARLSQHEIRYASNLAPRLMATEVFVRSQRLVDAIAGPMHFAFDHIIFKPGHSATTTPWHQDIAYRKLGGGAHAGGLARLHLWIPLQDTSLEQGCMEFVPGSHRAGVMPHRPFTRISGTLGREAAVPQAGERVACPIEAGGLTIHTPLTLHYTGANLTPRARGAWIIQFSRFGRMERAIKRGLGIAPRTVLAQ